MKIEININVGWKSTANVEIHKLNCIFLYTSDLYRNCVIGFYRICVIGFVPQLHIDKFKDKDVRYAYG